MSAREWLFRATTNRELDRTFGTYVATGSATGRDGMTPAALGQRWPSERATIRRKLRAGSYQFSPYKQLLVSKGLGQAPRVLSIPTVRDRVALKALAHVLMEVFPEARTKVPQALIGDVMKAVHSGEFHYFARLDIRSFYPSVRHALLEAALKSRIRSRPVLDALLGAITTPTLGKQGSRGSAPPSDKGVPQGLAVSNLLAEIAFNQIDNELGQLSDSRYFRYVDDILILTNSDPAEVFETACSTVRRRHFDVHPLGTFQKSGIGSIADGVDYLGYHWDGAVWGIRAASRQRVIDSIARDFSHYGTGPDRNPSALLQRVNLTISGCIYERHARGWMHFYSQTTDLDALRGLDRVVRKLATRHSVDPTKLKSFERTYWLIRHPDRRLRQYVPDFDTYSQDDMRALLSELHPGRDFESMKSPELERMFKAEVARIVSRLERDVGELS